MGPLHLKAPAAPVIRQIGPSFCGGVIAVCHARVLQYKCGEAGCMWRLVVCPYCSLASDSWASLNRVQGGDEPPPESPWHNRQSLTCLLCASQSTVSSSNRFSATLFFCGRFRVQKLLVHKHRLVEACYPV